MSRSDDSRTDMKPDQETPPDYEKMAGELGPFAPPPDYRFGPEFEPLPPRPIPRRLRTSLYARSWTQGLLTSLGLGALMVLVSRFSIIERLSLYFLPFGYLDWGGYALMGGTIIAALYHYLTPGRYVYIKEGIPHVVRFVGCFLKLDQARLAYGQKATMAQYVAVVQCLNPETSNLEVRYLESPRKFDASHFKRYALTAKPGDYLTAIYLPGRFEKSLRLYGFLEISPDEILILKNGALIQPTFTVERAAAIFLGFICLLWGFVGLLSFQIYWPLKDPTWAFLGAAIVGVILGILLIYTWTERVRRRNPFLSISRFWCVVGGACLGVFLAVFTLPMANALLDRSASTYREVAVVELWEVTHNDIFRTYEVEYRFLDSSDKHKYASTPDRMRVLSFFMAGVAEIKDGFFGWPWVRGLHPVKIVKTINGKSSNQDAATEDKDLNWSYELAAVTDNKDALPISDDLKKLIGVKIMSEGLDKELIDKGIDLNDLIPGRTTPDQNL